MKSESAAPTVAPSPADTALTGDESLALRPDAEVEIDAEAEASKSDSDEKEDTKILTDLDEFNLDDATICTSNVEEIVEHYDLTLNDSVNGGRCSSVVADFGEVGGKSPAPAEADVPEPLTGLEHFESGIEHVMMRKLEHELRFQQGLEQANNKSKTPEQPLPPGRTSLVSLASQETIFNEENVIRGGPSQNSYQPMIYPPTRLSSTSTARFSSVGAAPGQVPMRFHSARGDSVLMPGGLPVQVQVVEQIESENENDVTGGAGQLGLTEEAVRSLMSSDDEGAHSAGWASGRASLASNGTNFVSCADGGESFGTPEGDFRSESGKAPAHVSRQGSGLVGGA